jgi:hypothetical protein
MQQCKPASAKNFNQIKPYVKSDFFEDKLHTSYCLIVDFEVLVLSFPLVFTPGSF